LRRLSVKQLEEIVTKTNSPAVEREQAEAPVDPNVRAAQMELERLRVYGCKSAIAGAKGKSRLSIRPRRL
jgi:hypothetical protein